MRKLLLFVLMLTLSLAASAQNRTITGSLFDGELKERVPFAVVQLLRPDSAYVVGATSDESGNFKVTAPDNGRYILKASYVGYKTIFQNVTIANGQDVAVGQLDFQIDTHTLKEVKVVASAPKVVVKEDTFQYNASAYRVPEGSTIEALVKKLPGAEVSDDGTIKINGKEVKKILVNGKEFMVGDTKTAMKNLPTSIVDKIKAYDQQSDLSRVTGIDDGDESTVLDFGVKKGMNKGFFSNIDLGIGTKNRYSERGMAAYFNDKFRLMGFASANNVNDMGFGGGPRGGFGGVRQGLNATKMVGLNMNYDNGKTLQWDGSVRWNHSDGDLNTRVSAENFVATQGSFSNRLSQRYTRENSWDGRFRLEWTPDSLWNIMFRPNFRISKSDGETVSSSAAYNQDPYELVDDPLSSSAIQQLEADGVMVNSQRNTTVSYGRNTSVGGMLQVNRRLGRNGRNVTLRMDADYSDADSKTFSTQDLQYFQLRNALGQDSTYQAYRYNLMPTKSWSYAAQATYSEPIARRTYLQFSYQFKYGFSKSDRDTYDLSSLPSGTFAGVQPAYRSWGSYLGLLTSPLDGYLDNDLSRYSEYRTYTHDMQVMLRMNHEKWRMNVGVMLQPQHTTYMQDYLGVHVDTARTVVNWSPTFDFRYRFNEQSNLRVNYRGTASQPTMSQLLSIVDNTDPQNVSIGNPGLKPAFTNNFRLFYNSFRQSHAQSFMTFVNFSTTRNAIGNSVTYNAETGARTVQPVNVNGNWNANAAVMFNTSIDSAGVWNVNTFTRGGYNRYASYLQQNRLSSLEKNITNSLTLGERLSASYRISWLEVELDGSVDYTHTKNNLQSASNLSTWQFAYGGNLMVTLPWNMTLSTDLHENSRRGYNDASLNTNELLWNAQVSQSLLRGNALTLSLQFYDILHQQSNLSRVINATGRTDTEYNSINSYVMLRASYRLNLFGGKNAMQGPSGGRGFDRRGPGMGPRPAGRPMGGGRPRMGGGFGGF
ncbi:MAG: outer membrane beta-barrel protein [Prevotella sp.]|nr:outer membrane beta-barrel protein [Prevotella sp.]